MCEREREREKKRILNGISIVGRIFVVVANCDQTNGINSPGNRRGSRNRSIFVNICLIASAIHLK